MLEVFRKQITSKFSWSPNNEPLETSGRERGDGLRLTKLRSSGGSANLAQGLGGWLDEERARGRDADVAQNWGRKKNFNSGIPLF